MARTHIAVLSVLATSLIASIPIAQAGFGDGSDGYEDDTQAEEDGPFAPRHCAVPRVRPTWIVLRCESSGILVNDIRWKSWRNERARGNGTFHFKTCSPSCKDYPVKITLLKVRPKLCGVQRLPMFHRIRLEFPGRDPNLAHSDKKLHCID